jgi:galactitol-specific phosphotransferase system IIC component
MQLYCIAGSAAGRLTPTFDIDIWNVTLFWHFVLVTAVIAVAVVALFPLVA